MKANLSVEQLVLDILRDGALSVEALITGVSTKRHGVTRQGVYRVIRKLKKDEVVTVHHSTVSLSAIWISRMQNYFALASHYYSRPNTDSSFLNLREGEKISYSFKTLIELDVFWSHALYLFLEVTKNTTPVYIYNPHDWASVIRKENDEALIEKSVATKRQLFIGVGIKSALAKIARRNFDNDQGQFYIIGSELGFNRNYYVNVLDDYCIEGFLDKNLTEQLDHFYTEHTILSAEAVDFLHEIISRKGKLKLVISRNKKKAEKIKKVLNKYFYIKAEKPVV